MDRMEQLSILVVDDQEDIPEVCEDILRDELGHKVETNNNPASVPRLVRNRLFDVVLIDAKMTYKRAAYGGLLLAEEVATILGIESVIIMSQFDVKSDVLNLGHEFNFLSKPKGKEYDLWVQTKLLDCVRKLFRKQYGFVVMPYGDPSINDLYENTLVPWMKEAGFKIKRMDQMPGPRPINTELQKRIRQAHFVIVYAPEKNANVYFEAGFAVALDKFSIYFAPTIGTLPFDLQSNRVMTLGSQDKKKEKQEILQLMNGLRFGIDY